MQVRGLEPVGIDDAEPSDASAGEVLQHGNAEAPAPTTSTDARAQSRLAFGADFAQRDLARVVRCGPASCEMQCACSCSMLVRVRGRQRRISRSSPSRNRR